MSRGKSNKFSGKEFNDQFDAFLKESLSGEESTLDTTHKHGHLLQKNGSPQPWWACKDDGDDSLEIGITGTGKHFLKKPRGTDRNGRGPSKHVKFGVQDREDGSCEASHDEHDQNTFGKSQGENFPSSSRMDIPALTLGSTSYTDTVTADKPAGEYIRGPGRDTLDEIADKETFFKELEKDSASTIDYNELNRDIDTSATIEGTSVNTRSIFRPRKGGIQDESHSGDECDDGIVVFATGEDQPPQTLLGHNEKGLLEKVALLDSLESTLGTKPAASHETDMQTIFEGTQENGETYDDIDGCQPEEHTLTDGVQATENTHRGTFKTGTAFGYTDTSHEIEALHNALKQVGLSTMDDTKQFSLKDSSTVVEKTPDGTSDTCIQGTGVFGLRGIAPISSSKNRPISDQVDEGGESKCKKEGRAKHGLDLHPAIMEDQTGTEKKTTSASLDKKEALVTPNYNEHLDLSPEDEMVPPTSGITSSYHNLSTTKHSAGTFHGAIPVPAKRTKKPSAINMSKAIASNKKAKKVKYQDVRSSGYGQQDISQTIISKEYKAWSPPQTHKGKTKGPGDLIKKKMVQDQIPSIKDSHLMSSIESFASISAKEGHDVRHFKEVTEVSSAQSLSIHNRETETVKEVTDWQDMWKEERKKLAKAHAELASKEREFARNIQQIKVDYDQKIFRLKQENYVLLAKIPNTAKERSNRINRVDGFLHTEESQEQAHMEKEIREQEKLLVGYQQENERLYKEVKNIQLSAKTAENHMFEINQKLKSELALLREQLSDTKVELKNKGLITSDANQQYIASGCSTHIADLEAELKQARELQKMHESEIHRLKGKLELYAENKHFDKDETSLQSKNDEIRKLRLCNDEKDLEIEKNQTEIKAHMKEHSRDAEKIQDLERQVKEMEVIVRRKQLNSLPALMGASSDTPDQVSKLASAQYLEIQIQKLEQKLEEKDEDGKQCLRVLEQKYNITKKKYEERIEQLEEQLSRYCSHDEKKLKESDHPHTAFPRELEIVRDRYEIKIGDLEQELQNAHKEIVALKAKKYANVVVRKQTVNNDKGVDKRLRGPDDRSDPREDKGSIAVSSLSSFKSCVTKPKSYEPDSFEDQRVSKIIRENKDLKIELESVHLDVERQRLHVQKYMAEAECRKMQVSEEIDEKVATLQKAHQAELQSILAKHAIQHSGSKVAELQSKLDTQLVINKHLKEHFAQAQADSANYSALTVQEASLESQVKQLKDDLEEARKAHTPEMRHFEAMVTKVEEMENRHAQREKDLQQVIRMGYDSASSELEQEVEKWKNIVDTKNKETDRFKVELDTILEVLKELQRQGVILPFKAARLPHK